jgi:hypothetical protein
MTKLQVEGMTNLLFNSLDDQEIFLFSKHTPIQWVRGPCHFHFVLKKFPQKIFIPCCNFITLNLLEALEAFNYSHAFFLPCQFHSS